MRKSVLLCAGVILAVCVQGPLSAQQRPDPGDGAGGSWAAGNSSGGFRGDGSTGGAAGVPGGGAMADFDTLMNLIQTTVEPDSWLLNGGQSTMTQYPAGVYIDPKGHMKRVIEDVEVPELRLSKSERESNTWLEPSSRRVVSLKQLDNALRRAVQTRENPSLELARLAGLSKIEFVQIDLDNEDILIAGPSGDPALGFHLDDVAVITALIRANTAPIGCSIDPTDEGIRATQKMLSAPGTIQRLSRSPNVVAKQMHESVGPQNVTVFGISPRSSTAIALVDADEHMKKVGFGQAQLRTRIPTYFDHLSRLQKVPQQSLVRWWFAYGDEAVRVSSAGETYQLPAELVQVMSEQQWMTVTGRQPSGGSDAAADAFAKDFSAQIDSLRKTHPAYARLCAVFELSLSLQLVLESTGQPDLRAWLPTLCTLGTSQSEAIQEPKTVEGLATAERLDNGTVVAVVSGGVTMEPKKLAAKARLVESKYLAESVVPRSQPGNETAWWWSGE